MSKKEKLRYSLEVLNSPMSYTLDEVGKAYATLSKHISELKQPTSQEVEEALETSKIYIIELQECCYFRGTHKESMEFDTRRTMVLNQAKIYTKDSVAEIECENIKNAGKFKKAKIKPYFIKSALASKPNLEQLANEIIEELKRFGDYESVYFDKTYGLRCVTLYTDMSVPMHRLLKENISLAHKITTYFTLLEAQNEQR
jgi:hypothetical protein